MKPIVKVKSIDIDIHSSQISKLPDTPGRQIIISKQDANIYTTLENDPTKQIPYIIEFTKLPQKFYYQNIKVNYFEITNVISYQEEYDTQGIQLISQENIIPDTQKVDELFLPVYYKNNDNSITKPIRYEPTAYKLLENSLIESSDDSKYNSNMKRLYEKFIYHKSNNESFKYFIRLKLDDTPSYYGFEFNSNIEENPSQRMKPIVRVENITVLDADLNTSAGAKYLKPGVIIHSYLEKSLEEQLLHILKYTITPKKKIYQDIYITYTDLATPDTYTINYKSFSKKLIEEKDLILRDDKTLEFFLPLYYEMSDNSLFQPIEYDDKTEYTFSQFAHKNIKPENNDDNLFNLTQFTNVFYIHKFNQNKF